jgi:hypothetical protein
MLLGERDIEEQGEKRELNTLVSAPSSESAMIDKLQSPP